jgi:dihydrodipicolinate synthase/N-acetylneuraminate lyase
VRYAKSEAVPAGPATARLSALAPPARESALTRAGRLAVFGGHAGLYTLDALDAGAVGMIPGAECPRELVAILTAHRAGRRDQAIELYRALLPLLVFQIPTLDFYLACSKTILKQRGVLSCAALRAAWPLDAWSERALARYAALTLGLDWTGETAAADAAGHLG